MRRAIPVCLVVLAALADSASAHEAALYALLAAIPATVVVALDELGAWLTPSASQGLHGVRALLWTAALALIVVGAGVRAHPLEDGVVPELGAVSLSACLALFCAQGVLAVALELRARSEPARKLSRARR
jgi:hypothetical protein